jgi:hypothetical protein
LLLLVLLLLCCGVQVDMAIQYGEDADVKIRDEPDLMDDGEDG